MRRGAPVRLASVDPPRPVAAAAAQPGRVWTMRSSPSMISSSDPWVWRTTNRSWSARQRVSAACPGRRCTARRYSWCPRPRSGNARPGRGGAPTRSCCVAGRDLPGAVEEVTLLRDLYASPTVLLPPASTIDAVLPPLATADVAHVACHGRLRADNPAFSGLQLQDGLLTLHEMEPPRRRTVPHDLGVLRLRGRDGVRRQRGPGFRQRFTRPGDLRSGGQRRVGARRGFGAADARPASASPCRVRPSGSTVSRPARELDLDDQREFVNWCAFNAYGAA